MNNLEILDYKEIKETIDKIVSNYIFKILNETTLDNIISELKIYLSTLDLIDIDFELVIDGTNIYIKPSNEYTKEFFILLNKQY